MAYRTINAFSLDQRNFSSVGRSGTGSWVVPAAAAFLDGSGLRLPGTVGNYASAPDSSELSVLGDIDIKVKLELPDWSPSSLVFVLSKWLTTGDQRSFYFGVDTTGALSLTVDGDGTGTFAVSANSTAATGFADGVTKWIRATLDVDNGSSGAVFKFYTSDDGDTWSQLGTNVTSGVISIYDSTAVLEVGSYNTGVVGHAPMTVYRTIIQDAFDTTDNTTSVVFDADFSSQVPFTQSFTEDSGIATPATVTINAATPSVATATSKIPMFPTYIPSENAPYALEALVTAIPTTNGHSTVEVYSPLVPSTAGAVYTFSVGAMPLNNNLNYIIEPQFYETFEGVALVESGRTPTPVNVTDGTSFLLYDYVQAPTGSTYCRIKITIGGYRTIIATPVDLPEDVGSVFFDPIICDASANAISFFSNSVYSSLPSFMLLDDENINNILPAAGGASQSPQPLRRYVEVLCNAADKMYLELDEFRYDRAVDGDEHKSKLVDPDTAEARYLLWLAAATGSRLLTFISGLTPWAALEASDGDGDGTPGEWEDFQAFNDWLELESENPEFFDAVQSYRDQIRTGVTGLNGGRPDKIVEYVRTILDSNNSDTDVVVLHNEHMDSPFRAKIVVDPNVDPDASGSLIEDFVNNVGSVGSYIVKDSKVHHSGRGVYQFDDALYPNTYSNAAACGSVIYGQPFISDYDYTGQHIVLNAEATGVSAAAADGAVVPDLGGGIGHSHYSADSSYFFGWDGSTPGSLTTAGSSIANLGGSTNYDVIAVLTDIIEPSADVWSQVSTSTPSDYLFRQKRLIVCGTDSGGTDNDWALYMVSGLTVSADNDVRLLLVDGYMDTSGADNYVYSDPIDSSYFSQHKNFCLRVSKTGTSYKFYVQNSLYDDWESNVVGSGTFNPSSSAADTLSNAGVQVLGELDNSLWSDAYPLACAVKRVMVFNDTLTFVSEGDTSASAHAISNGGEIDDFGVYSYIPSIDIDVSGVALYATSFNAVTYQSGVWGTVLVDVNKASSNEIDILAMRPHPTYGALWHFGNAPNETTDDQLRVTFSGSAQRYWRIHTINPSDGSIVTSATQDAGSTATINIDSYPTYAGASVLAIEVRAVDSGWGDGTAPGTNPMAYFTPDLLTTTDSASDSYTGTWSITRAWPSESFAYSPSQTIDLACIHMYESKPEIAQATNAVHGFTLEHWSPFSMFFHIKRVWTGTEGTDIYNIFNVDYGSNAGFRIYYDGPKIKATFSDGTNTESVEWEETSPSYGDWHTVVVRRNSSTFGIVVDADTAGEATTALALTTPLPDTTPSRYFSEGGEGVGSTWTPRFALARFTFFNRYLSDGEIALLETEV